jgi:thioredoxin reductase
VQPRYDMLIVGAGHACAHAAITAENESLLSSERPTKEISLVLMDAGNITTGPHINGEFSPGSRDFVTIGP